MLCNFNKVGPIQNLNRGHGAVYHTGALTIQYETWPRLKEKERKGPKWLRSTYSEGQQGSGLVHSLRKRIQSFTSVLSVVIITMGRNLFAIVRGNGRFRSGWP